MQKLKIGVIFGGKSGEHEVSLKSARSVIKALDKEKFEIIPIGIRKNGEWISGRDPLAELETGENRNDNFVVTMMPDPSNKGVWRLDPFKKLTDIDVIFPVLHGTYGEDGTIQGFFEMCNIPYVGSGVIGSSLAMDKIMMKRILECRGLQVANYFTLKRTNWENDREEQVAQIERNLSYPMFVKPANLGSSVGISKVKERKELYLAIDIACQYDMKCLVEEYIPGREIELSIIGNDNPRASVLGEVIPANEFYDYSSKYLDDRSELVIPAQLSKKLSEKTRQIGIEAYQLLECFGLCRVDFFVLEEQEEVYLNELNTMPGFTEISMYPKLWIESGMSYQQLLTELVELALHRQEEQDRNSTEFPGD